MLTAYLRDQQLNNGQAFQEFRKIIEHNAWRIAEKEQSIQAKNAIRNILIADAHKKIRSDLSSSMLEIEIAEKILKWDELRANHYLVRWLFFKALYSSNRHFSWKICKARNIIDSVCQILMSESKETVIAKMEDAARETSPDPRLVKIVLAMSRKTIIEKAQETITKQA